MAGRCVTRGTDAGLVYYSAISTSKTANKRRGESGEGEGGNSGGAERANLAARSKEWRTSQITRLLCDTQPSAEIYIYFFRLSLSLPPSFCPGEENLLVDEEIPAKRASPARAGLFLKLDFS